MQMIIIRNDDRNLFDFLRGSGLFLDKRKSRRVVISPRLDCVLYDNESHSYYMLSYRIKL